MTPDEVKTGQFYILKEPIWTKAYGQNKPHSEMVISFPDKEYCLAWGTVFKASETCDPVHSIANMSASPYPLIRTSFILDHIDQFEMIVNVSENK